MHFATLGLLQLERLASLDGWVPKDYSLETLLPHPLCVHPVNMVKATEGMQAVLPAKLQWNQRELFPRNSSPEEIWCVWIISQ